MKIVVLAGGLSPERNVSLSSGSKVCQTLRERGHQVAFVDMYLGTDQEPDALFDAPLAPELTKVARQAPNLEALKAQRGGDSFFGPGVLELCAMADVVFLAAPAARTAGSRQPWLCWAFPLPARAIWAVPLPWIRT